VVKYDGDASSGAGVLSHRHYPAPFSCPQKPRCYRLPGSKGQGRGSLQRETGGGGGLDRRSVDTVYLQIWLRESGATRCWALLEDRSRNLCPWVDSPLRQATQGQGPYLLEGARINSRGNRGPQDEPILRSTTLNLYLTFQRQIAYLSHIWCFSQTLLHHALCTTKFALYRCMALR
jgi:hypothetical protein